MDVHQDLINSLEALAKHKTALSKSEAQIVLDAASTIKRLSRVVFELAHAYAKVE